MTYRKWRMLGQECPKVASWVHSFFLILIDSISNLNLTCKLGIFADDTRAIREIASQVDANSLQSDFEQLYNWAKANNMTFNGDKFESIKYGENSDLKGFYNYINSENEDIEDVSNLRDLGITIFNDGTFKEYIIKVVKKARRLCGWIDRSFIRNDIYWRRHMLRTYVLPVLDYGSQVWSPTNQSDLNLLESIQCSYTSNTDGLDTLDYWDRLKCMNIQSIQQRHERYKIIYIWKIMNGLVPQYNLQWTSNDRRGKMVTIPNFKTEYCTTVKNMRQSSLTVHGGGIFNMLPAYIQNFIGTLEEFKNARDKFLENIPDKPAISGMYPDPVSRANVTSIRNSNSLRLDPSSGPKIKET